MNDVLLHTELVLQKIFTQKAPPHSKTFHDETFTQRISSTQTFFFYTEASTQRIHCTEQLSHTQKLLRREASTRSNFHTHTQKHAEKPLHGATLTHR